MPLRRFVKTVPKASGKRSTSFRVSAGTVAVSFAFIITG